VRQLIVSTFVTLDGVREAPGGEPGHPHTGWVAEIQTAEQVAYKFEEVQEAGSLLLGRVTYESFAGAWPNYSGEFADRMNAMPKHVASTTLRAPAWNNTTVIAGDVAGEVRRLKRDDGAPILVVGSGTLVHALMAERLVDEFRVMIFPVVLGSGRRLFPETPDKTVLRLAGTRTFGSGVVEHRYRVG
jgi:dihydrofolate reductase